MSFIPKPHEIYKHFKGNLYQVTAIAEHTETGEQLVIYQALYGGFQTYARPLSMFTGRLDRERYPGAAQEFRFELQGPEAGRQRAESEADETDHAAAGQGGRTVRDGGGRADGAAVGGHTAAEGISADMSASGGKMTEERMPERGQHADRMPEEEEEPAVDPLVLEFLDADSYGEKLNILAALHHRITDEMITTMAIASDIEINDGDIEDRYEALKTCLLTRERYECSRLR